jgi:hypothetical protein
MIIKKNNTVSQEKYFIYIFTEDKCSGNEYFKYFTNPDNKTIKPQKAKSSSPIYILNAIKNKKTEFEKKDSVYVVVDKDSWTNNQLEELKNYCINNDYYFCMSNPCFEYWLLLHFEKGEQINSANQCKQKLLSHIPTYSKNFKNFNTLFDKLDTAIRNAKEKGFSINSILHLNGSTIFEIIERENLSYKL